MNSSNVELSSFYYFYLVSSSKAFLSLFVEIVDLIIALIGDIFYST